MNGINGKTAELSLGFMTGDRIVENTVIDRDATHEFPQKSSSITNKEE